MLFFVAELCKLEHSHACQRMASGSKVMLIFPALYADDDDHLGSAVLQSGDFHPDGFEGHLGGTIGKVWLFIVMGPGSNTH